MKTIFVVSKEKCNTDWHCRKFIWTISEPVLNQNLLFVFQVPPTSGKVRSTSPPNMICKFRGSTCISYTPFLLEAHFQLQFQFCSDFMDFDTIENVASRRRKTRFHWAWKISRATWHDDSIIWCCEAHCQDLPSGIGSDFTTRYGEKRASMS